MPHRLVEDSTPAHLLPKIGGLPTSNTRHFTSAHITRMAPPAHPAPGAKQWIESRVDHRPEQSAVSTLAWHPSGSRVAAADNHGRIRVISTIEENRAPVEFGFDDETSITSLTFTAAGDQLLAGTANGQVQIWRLDNEGSPISADELRIDGGSTPHLVFADSHLLTTLDNRLALVDALPGADVEPRFATFENADQEATKILAVVSPEADSMAAVVVDTNGFGTVIHTSDGGHSYRRTSLHDHGPIRQAALNSTMTLVAIETDRGEVWQVHFQIGEMEARNSPSEVVASLVYDQISHDLYVLGDDGALIGTTIDGVDFFDLNLSHRFGTPPTTLSVNGKSKILAAGYEDGVTTTWTDGSSHINSALIPPPPRETLYQARPAEGVLLTHEQSWAMEGIALGELLHGVSLAPGEVTQLAITSHGQSVMQNSADVVSQQERIDSSSRSSGDLTEHEDASANQSQFGMASASSSSSTDEEGGGLFFASGGGSHTSTSAVHAAMSVGHRDVSAASSQGLHQSAHQQANQNRQRYSAAVREVSEHESQEMQTRVVANYNHMHALNLQFYEVVQVQRLRTRVVDAHRLLFVPVDSHDLGIPEIANRLVNRFPAELTATLHQLGLHDAATCIDYVFARKDANIEVRQQQLDRLWEKIRESTATVVRLTDAANDAVSAWENANKNYLVARDEYREMGAFQFWRHYELQRDVQRTKQRLVTTERVKIRAQADLERARNGQRQLALIERRLRRFLDPPSHSAAEDSAEETGEGVVVNNAPQLDHAVLARCVERLAKEMHHQSTAINQGLWTRMDPSLWAGLLQRHTYRNQPIGATVDPHPVAFANGYVGFRWNFEEPGEELRFQAQHLNRDELTDAIPMPTGGIFGEAVLGDSNAADKIDITRFWNWSDSLPPIRPPGIEPLAQKESEPLVGPTAPDIQPSTVNLGPITFPQMSSSISEITGALTNQELFQDLGSTKAAAALAQSAVELSAQGAHESAELANKNFKRFLQFQSAMADTAIKQVQRSQQAERPVDPTLAGAAINAANPDGERAGDGAEGPEQRHGGQAGRGRSITDDGDKPPPAEEADGSQPLIEFVHNDADELDIDSGENGTNTENGSSDENGGNQP